MPKSGDPLTYTHPPNYVNPPSSAWQVTTANSVGLALATLVLAARCYTKFRITKAPGWEDYFSILAWVVFVVYCALEMIQRCHYGGGRHLYDIPPSMYYGYFWTGVVRSYLYILGLTLAKLSLLFFLYRIFRVDRLFRIISWLLGAILVIWTAVSLLLCIFACKPIKASWVLSVQLDPRTKCPIKAYDVNNYHGFCNIITDFVLLFLPVPLLWKLHVNGRKKLGLAIVFGTAIVRQYISYRTDKNGDDYYIAKLRVWCEYIPSHFPPRPSSPRLQSIPTLSTPVVTPALSLEFSFSIIVASLPVITPLLKKANVFSSWLPILRSRFGGSSGRMPELPPWPKEQEQQQQQHIAKNNLMNPRHADIELGGERGTPRTDGGGNRNPVSSWKVPDAWKEPAGQRQQQYQRKSLDVDEHERDDEYSHGSDLTLRLSADQKGNGHVVRA
ncbi:MAG: hypothetical protein Q9207_006467 [Kuettlingeria erythrocarpa]